ncbi:Scarecrow-like protein [Musa troglodytarum]|uniref:Scarecrow-like protein n=1 Tax=Musa troglodytarum TaxID=320322 RepID=A0A9E7HC49_9LILI|nr:Scarecrow-like protein [Musa troglodytarum]
MRGLPYHAQGKGGLEAVETIFEGNQALFWVNKRPKLVIQQGREPRSVLDHRSPSPPTSTATLSSSLGGGGGSSDTAGVAAVSDIPTNKWVLSDSTAEESGGAVGKEEWAAELQPIPTGLDMGFVAGGQKYGLGVDDWEAILSETSAASPGREQTFFRWIMGDVDDPSAAGFKQHQQQLLSHGSVEFDGNSSGLGFGIPDPGIGLGSIGRTADEASVSAPTDSSLPLSSNVTSGGGFSLVSSSSRVSPAIVHAYIKGATFGHQTGSQLFSLPPQAGNSISSPLSLPQGMYFPDTVLDKPQLFGPGLLLNQASATPNPPFFLSAAQAEQQQLPQLLPPTQLKRHPAIADQIPQKLPFLDSAASSDLFLRRQSYQEQSHGFPLRQLQNRSVKPVVAAFGDDVTSAVAAQQQHLQQALADLLFEAAKMVEARNFVGAHGILARLNQQLPSPSGKPLIRSAFYFKEALQLIISNGSNTVPSATPTSHHPLTTQLDVVHKLSAYKAFSEVSPIIRFANFTCIQALLEELDGCDCIHIMDFDIGFGGQWSSFMQELAQRRCSSAGAVRMLKITVFVSHYSQNNMELHLIQDNLSQFASDLNIPFELKVHSLDSFDPLELHGLGGEAIAVNLPIGSAYLSFPALLRLMKQLSPKIVVSVDQGCDRSDLPFLQHFLHAFQSSLVLMDSIDASGTNQDTASKIERVRAHPVQQFCRNTG